MIRFRPLALALLLAPALALAHVSVDPGATDAVATVDAFTAALKAADLARVEALLDADVKVLESGGAENSRAQYLEHHAGADAEFLKDANVRVLHRTARSEGDLAWVATESEVEAGGKPHLATETMVLKRSAEGWRIVHIHWSSRPKK